MEGKKSHTTAMKKINRISNRYQCPSYLGPEFSDEHLQFYLDAMQIKYLKVDQKSLLVENVSRLISENKIVGWFQGRMEWGPRALGNRSILANAGNPKMQDILNKKVKHREEFRPFAPAVCEGDVREYFEVPDPIPDALRQMLMVFQIKNKWIEKLPSIKHVDGSCRIQVVRRSENSDFYDLIKSVGIKTGIPVIINTSFNIRGEPIVCTPDDAYTCMMGTGIDVLVMGSFIVERELNEGDRWDSKSLAND